METSQTIVKISIALLGAQKEMANAVKDSNNPFFKSKYADLNSVREACMPALNKFGISLIQPIVSDNGKNYVNTILLHESGEFLSGLTEIMYAKQNDAQAQGSGITYARRYGMQSMCNIGVEDDDGNKASNPLDNGNQNTSAPANDKPWLNETDKESWSKVVAAIKGGKTIADIQTKWAISKPNQAKLLEQAK